MSNVEIKSVENGPNLILVDGKVQTAICRCGASKKQPYCDGTHAKIAFNATPTQFKVL